MMNKYQPNAKELKEQLNKKVKREVYFEGYLQDIYIESEHPLDDMIPDGFNDWLENIDIQEVIDYAQEYAEKIYKGNK